MGWKEPPRETFVKLGEDDGKGYTRSEIEGVLVDIIAEPPEGEYEAKYVVQLELDDGTIATITPPGWLSKRQVKASHVGKLVRFVYKGMAVSKAGNEYKDVRYQVYTPQSADEEAKIADAYPSYGAVSMESKPRLQTSDLPF